MVEQQNLPPALPGCQRAHEARRPGTNDDDVERLLRFQH
jgi:hypothetical protein